MDLGDGLMFELENGKPKLVLANYDESKTSSKVGQDDILRGASDRGRLSEAPYKNKVQKTTVNVKQCSKEPERLLKERKSREAAVTNHAERGTTQASRKTKVKVSRDHCSVIDGLRVQSEGKTKSTDESSKATEKLVKESLVCLTQEQLQQILNSIKTSGQNIHKDSATTHIQNGGLGTKEEHASIELVNSSEAAELLLDSSNHRNRNSQRRGNYDNETPLDSTTGSGLFSTFGERERGREALEAKRAQWRRELDEQMALKKQQKGRMEISLQREPSAGLRSKDQPSMVQDVRITRTATNGNPATSLTHSRQRNLPSATRSAFVLGEATPLEHAFGEEKKHQQRQLLQVLEQQREEAKLRKKLERQSQNQAEDHEHWAMHFDSFQRCLPPQQPTAPPLERGEIDMGSSQSHHRSPSGAQSTAWENMSTFGGDSLGRASVDTTQGFQEKSSYLRTMTALLDPIQLEERERKRIKQLEQQRALEAQMEEQRRQKEREEAARQAQELEEERRVVRERELLQQQYLMDTQQQKQKEDLRSRKVEELYLRAQEEAQKDKHQQRIRNRAEKGNDVSNLLKKLEPDSSLKSAASGPEDMAQTEEAPSTGRKDTAVQTEISEVSSAGTGVAEIGNNNDYQASSAHTAPTLLKRSRRDARLLERNSGKENVLLARKEVDPYEGYARTDRSHPWQPGRKPEWNTHRPSKPFVPASERYPTVLQRHRQESRMRRQMELLTLVERNTFSRTSQQQDPSTYSINPSHHPQRLHSARRKGADPQRRQSTSNTHSRGNSPPVPALKPRLDQFQQHSALHTEEPEEHAEITDWPPSSDYIPYVRTDEVYLPPISRPTTCEAPQKTHPDVTGSRDPLLHPELLESTKRQQAILKGLAELRQGLLQKQREVERSMDISPGQSRTHSPVL